MKSVRINASLTAHNTVSSSVEIEEGETIVDLLLRVENASIVHRISEMERDIIELENEIKTLEEEARQESRR